MPRIAESEAIVWGLTSELRRLRGDYERLQIVLSILLRRDESAQVVITAEEMLEFSPGIVLHSSSQPDGGLRLWVTQ